MNTFVLEQWSIKGLKCSLYTVRWEDEEVSETDKFFEKYASDYEKEVDLLIHVLTYDIAEKNGAKEFFFNRNEDLAQALPPKMPNYEFARIRRLPKKFPLRLYCLKLSDNFVVLFNGGIKTSQTVDESPDLIPHFKAAQYFSKALYKEYRNGTILEDIDNKILTDFNGNTEIIFE